MSLITEVRRRARHVAAPVLGAIALFYFGYHAIQGEHGVIAWFELSQQMEQARAELAVATAERAFLEHRVALLRPESLDRDLLDERARHMLNLARPDEFVVLDPERRPD